MDVVFIIVLFFIIVFGLVEKSGDKFLIICIVDSFICWGYNYLVVN